MSRTTALTRRTARSGNDVCGVLVQYPATDGSVIDYADFTKQAQAKQCEPTKTVLAKGIFK